MTGWQHVSLFAGVGGADLGLHAAGVPTVAAVEIDTQARGVLAHRFPHATLFSDVHEVTGDDLRRAGAVPGRTILSGGFPCQPFSVAGRRKGVDDDRGELFWQIDRLLAEFPAAWVVLENVPGLLSIDGGRTMGTILRDLGERGYGFAYRVLDAQHFGVPQRRRRVFIVGHLGDDRGPVDVLLEPEGGGGDSAPGVPPGPGATRRDAGGAGGVGLAVDIRQGAVAANGVTHTLQSKGSGGYSVNCIPLVIPYVKTVRSGARDSDGNLPPEVWAEQPVAPTLNVMDNGGESRATVLAVTGDVAHTLRAEGADASEDGTGRGTPIVAFHRAQDPIYEVDGTPALGASSIGMGVYSSSVRRLTPVECERLMGWPDGHTAHRVDFRTGAVVAQADSSRYRQCGNGMAAPVVEWVARRILAVEDGAL